MGRVAAGSLSPKGTTATGVELRPGPRSTTWRAHVPEQTESVWLRFSSREGFTAAMSKHHRETPCQKFDSPSEKVSWDQ